MKVKKIKIVLPEGEFLTVVLTFSENDRKKLAIIYKEWRNLSKKLIKIGSRAVNLPEGLSESAFCLEMNMVRVTENISGTNTSFDAYNLKTTERVQIKACSVLPDLTSFGPSSVWDKIYFVDFFREGNWDGTFDIYLIGTSDIYNHKVNKTETVKDQQKDGKRPRFSIYSGIIKVKNLRPIKTGSLFI